MDMKTTIDHMSDIVREVPLTCVGHGHVTFFEASVLLGPLFYLNIFSKHKVKYFIYGDSFRK